MNRFSWGVTGRIALLAALTSALTYGYARGLPAFWLLPGAGGLALVGLNLYHYVTGVNRKLTRFLESIRYSDFAVSFRADSNLSRDLSDLNAQFNEVLEAFRQARAEKETNLQYLNTIVQHVGVGLLAFDGAGTVELVNQTALRLLGIYRLRQLSELQAAHAPLLALLRAGSVQPAVYQIGDERELSVRCTSVRLRGRLLTLVSLQNIRSELQQRELDAWQNLTKVLRHEIMNSVTPLVSLADTMRQIVDTELTHGVAPPESVSDLRDALTTIEHRGRGIMRFVDAYRHFTSIPTPQLTDVVAADLLRHVVALVQPDMQSRGIRLHLHVADDLPPLRADAGQVEMVLLNLLKNAVETLDGHPAGQITLSAGTTAERLAIQVMDNGPGIEPEALEKIFIPFFTTKKTGSGIGLSLSRQIMQLHGGQLKVESRPGGPTTFSLLF